MAENRHIFNNLTQVEKIKPKIDNPIIVEDVTYNFSDLIENEWISHFPQYSHRMRSTFVKGAGIVDEHLANINQCLIQLEDELYRVYDKLSDDKKAEVTEFIQARQNEVNEFIQARKDEVASFISDRKSEVADFIKDRKNEVATFISDKQHLVDEFVQARQNEVANFIQSKTNEVSNYINQKEEQITRFIENKDNEIKRRTDTLDDYTKNLEGKIDQFNLVIQGGEATEDKLGLIKLSTISEQVQVATVENLKKALITPNFKDTTPVKWSVNITVQYSKKEKKIVVDNLNKTKLDYVFDSSNYSEFANCRKQTETITRADEEVKNVDKVIYLTLKQVIVSWRVISEDGKINKTIEEVVPTQYIPFIYRFDPSKYPELGGYVTSEDSNSINIDDEGDELLECIVYLILRTEKPEPPRRPMLDEALKELDSLANTQVSTYKFLFKNKPYVMAIIKEYKIDDQSKTVTFFNGKITKTKLRTTKFENGVSTYFWEDGTVDYFESATKTIFNVVKDQGTMEIFDKTSQFSQSLLEWFTSTNVFFKISFEIDVAIQNGNRDIIIDYEELIRHPNLEKFNNFVTQIIMYGVIDKALKNNLSPLYPIIE